MASDTLNRPHVSAWPGKLMKNRDLAPGDTAAASEDAKASQTEAEPRVQAANEDSPTGGALYRMIARRPSKRIFGAAALASLFCIGAEAAYLWGLYGIEGLQTLTQLETGLIAAAVIVTLTLIWMLAWTIWLA